MRYKLRRFVKSALFQNIIVATILLAAALVGLETYPSLQQQFAREFHFLDQLIIGIFTLEVLLKLCALGKRFPLYFRDSWNLFDFAVVVVCYLPINAHYVAVVRLIRILRVLRLITAVRKLQILVNALLKSIPSMVYVSLLLLLIFYVYGVLGRSIFGANDPVHFGTLGISMISLFQVVTLEGWDQILYTQMYGCDQFGFANNPSLCQSPESFPVLAPIFFISLIILGAMIILNLFVGVVLSGMTEAQKDAEQRTLESTGERRVGNLAILRDLRRINQTLVEMQGRMNHLQDRLQDQHNQEQNRPVQKN